MTPNTALKQTPDPGADQERRDLESIGGALVQLEAYTRQRGFDALADLIDDACEWADAALTG